MDRETGRRSPLQRSNPTGQVRDGGHDNREYHYTEEDFEFIRALVYRHAGISLSPAKRELVYARLIRRLRALGLHSFSQYCALLRQQEQGGEELDHCINAITTNLTAFFREAHHFEFLKNTVVPELQERAKKPGGSRRVRIWSAGCSSGEEPYSIAMTLLPYFGSGGWDCRILATDLDSDTLAIGERGIYPADRITGLSEEQLKRYFEPVHVSGQRSVCYKVRPEVRSMVHFRRLNLMGEWPMKGPFDILFCRNVVIYFDKATQRRLFARYADIMREGSYLFIGHAESLFDVCNRFKFITHTIYRRV
jgi:chemotaxis protein methyltransferase CheR